MQTKAICPSCTVTMRLIKSEDLNHHGTLFAGLIGESYIRIDPVAEEDRNLYEIAKNLRSN